MVCQGMFYAGDKKDVALCECINNEIGCLLEFIIKCRKNDAFS